MRVANKLTIPIGPGDAPIAPDEVRRALAILLASPGFSRAQRMARLLAYLVESQLSGAFRDTTEYAIGIAVFGRDPGRYSTQEDPIVRVQAGRLRARLAAHYAGDGRHDPLRIQIPVGSYLPRITRARAEPAPGAFRKGLAVLSIACLSRDAAVRLFCLGLDEEVAHRLFHLGGIALLPGKAASADASHVLEGSVRTDGDRLRLSLRLTDRTTGVKLCAEQFDHPLPLGIGTQEALARAIADVVQRHLGAPVPAPVHAAAVATARSAASEGRRNVVILPPPAARDYLVPVGASFSAARPR